MTVSVTKYCSRLSLLPAVPSPVYATELLKDINKHVATHLDANLNSEYIFSNNIIGKNN